MKLGLTLFLACGSVLVITGCTQTPRQPSPEYGAIAFDQSSRAYGMSWGQPNMGSAQREARKTCGSSTCGVIGTFGPGQCATLASRPKGVPVIAIADTETTTRQKALLSCGSDCGVIKPECNG